MLSGEYQHSVDAKGRMFFPTKLKEELGESFVVCRGLEKCLLVYSKEEWAILEARIRALPFSKARDLQRFFFANAAECEVDKQGRLLVPQTLREYAALTKDITIIGALTRAEIWETEAWRTYNENLRPENIINAMDELGF